MAITADSCSLSPDEAAITQRLRSLGPEAGFPEADFTQLLAGSQ